MSGGNQKIVLGEICQVTDCEHKTAPFQDEGIPMIRTPNIGKGVLLLDGVKRVSEETYKLWSRRAIPKPGDLIMAREAPVGNVAIIPLHTKVCLGQRTVLLRPDNKIIESQYLNFLLNGDYLSSLLLTLSNGATVGHLNVTEIRNLSLPSLPSLATQRKIAAVLSAYDDLIENNNKRIALLEKAAEEIYREWFVRLRFPGWETAVFRKTAAGLIPETWTATRFDKEISNRNGYAFKSKDYVEDGARIVRTQDFAKTKYVELDNNVFVSLEKSLEYERFTLEYLDYLIVMVGASIGKHGIVFEKDLPALQNQNMWVFRPKPRSQLSRYYLYYFLPILTEYVKSSATGAARDFFRKEHFNKQMIFIPSESVMEQYNNINGPKIEAINILLTQTLFLKKSRDMLLSRLISGKLSLDDLDIQFPPSMIPT